MSRRLAENITKQQNMESGITPHHSKLKHHKNSKRMRNGELSNRKPSATPDQHRDSNHKLSPKSATQETSPASSLNDATTKSNRNQKNHLLKTPMQWPTTLSAGTNPSQPQRKPIQLSFPSNQPNIRLCYIVQNQQTISLEESFHIPTKKKIAQKSTSNTQFNPQHSKKKTLSKKNHKTQPVAAKKSSLTWWKISALLNSR